MITNLGGGVAQIWTGQEKETLSFNLRDYCLRKKNLKSEEHVHISNSDKLQLSLRMQTISKQSEEQQSANLVATLFFIESGAGAGVGVAVGFKAGWLLFIRPAKVLEDVISFSSIRGSSFSS